MEATALIDFCTSSFNLSVDHCANTYHLFTFLSLGGSVLWAMQDEAPLSSRLCLSVLRHYWCD